MSSEKQYIELFRSARSLIEAHSPAALNAFRSQCEAAFEQGGLPTAKDERYKYCDVQDTFAPDYGLNLRRAIPDADPYETYRCAVPNLSTALFYVLGDVPVVDQAKVDQFAGGAKVYSFRQAEAEMPHFIEQYYHRAAGKGYDGVTALNTLFAQDGLLIYIPDGVRLKSPLQVVNVSAATQPLMSNRRVLIVAGKGSTASILFCDHASGETPYLTTQVVEAFLDEKAEIELYSIEETSESNVRFNNLYAEQQAGSRLTHNGVVLTCGQTRNKMDVRLLGQGATMVGNGAVIADAQQRVDNNLLVEHIAPSCTSDLLYKYVLDDHSTGAFAGKVLVREGAQKTVSQQTNANICAAPTAHAYAQPMLEIYADDVKCNHGSSIGKLDETALFYMRQRGIPDAEARLLLQHAFINDVLRRIDVELLRDRLSHLVELRFRGQLSRCRDCSMCR